jgi:hypothetical protein
MNEWATQVLLPPQGFVLVVPARAIRRRLFPGEPKSIGGFLVFASKPKEFRSHKLRQRADVEIELIAKCRNNDAILDRHPNRGRQDDDAVFHDSLDRRQWSDRRVLVRAHIRTRSLRLHDCNSPPFAGQ